ncbi:MAG: hypothetical protein CSB16_00745 [Clostridiales bacterium]|nr:MAG: hypothetical protein CSB16_00745 [Clostridiales bacterium]
MKVGVIGTNWLVEEMISIFNKCGAEVLAVYSRSADRAKFFSENNNIKLYFDDLEKMLQVDDIDIVYIASPNAVHHEQAELALLSGKHVIIEKPIVLKLDDLQDLIDIAEKHKLFVFEAVTTLHLPNYQKIKEMIEEIGDIKLVDLNFSKYSSKYDDFLNGTIKSVFNREMGGGALNDMNVYNIHFLLGLFGTPRKYTYYPNVERGIDTSGIVVAQYDSFTATLSAGKDVVGNSHISIQGVNGLIRSSSSSSTIENFEFVTFDKSVIVDVQDKNIYEYEMQDFIKIIENRDVESYKELLAQSRNVVEVLERINNE